MPRIRINKATLVVLCLLLLLTGVLGQSTAGDRVAVRSQLDVHAGSLVVVPVEVEADNGFESAAFVLRYSEKMLTFVEAYRTDVTRDFDVRVDHAIPGEVSVGIRGRPLVLGRADVAWLLFRSHGAAGDQTELALGDASINGVDDVIGQSGWIQLGAAQVVLDFPTDLTAGMGEEFTASLSVDDGTGVLAADITIAYDPSVIQALSVAQTPLSQSLTLTPNLADPGVILISLFGTQPMDGGGAILEFDFQVLGLPGQSTPLDIFSVTINEGAIGAIIQDGLFTACDGTDFDLDGVSICDGDCADDNVGRFPGNPEIGCDGIDQDCDVQTSDIVDADEDSFTCDLDCNDTNPAINPDAEEVCDGLDNDCDLGIDNVPIPTDLVQVSAFDEAASTLSWSAVVDATGYDVVRGTLSGLRSSLGDFSQAVEMCLVDDAPEPFLDDGDSPLTSDGFWYVVRPTNCGGAGSYESGGGQQSGLRDAETATSPLTCP